MNLDLPLPPSVNHCYVNALVDGRRMRVLNKRGRAWMDSARLSVLAQTNRQGWEMTKGEKVVVEYEVYWPDKRQRDPSNLEKLLLDALEGLVYDNDKWALPRCIDFMVDRTNPRVEVACYRKKD